ncbi:aminomethyl-transferring glycine dehydrogenase subunit GcvPA [bacterium]|nr:aminomethyl-transferring glycine dehydrogenase subunit GcvPA [bacterium]
MYNFKANSAETTKEMLASVGVKEYDDLYSVVPEQARMKEFNLPEPMSEMEVEKEISAVSKRNNTNYLSFLGGGAYKRFIPSAVSQISSRFEFNTAYTPYQPEISQGTLQVIYEFQSYICDLTGMDVANASVYDGANACAEAMLMAKRITGSGKILVSSLLNPQYIEVIKTYAEANAIDVEFVGEKDMKTDLSSVQDKVKSGEYSALFVQTPNFLGEIEDVDELKALERNPKTLLITSIEPVSAYVLKKPSYFGADIVVGDVQSFGNPVSFGGPYCGFIATVDKYKRQLAGRIVGKTVDAEGNTAYTLTLQAREQHIKREKATSNICSNQALSALNATVYLSLMGKNGLKQVGYLSSKQAHLLSSELSKNGFRTLNNDFFNEFVLEVGDSKRFLEKMKEKNILAGVKLNDSQILVCTTEMNTTGELKAFVKNALLSSV